MIPETAAATWAPRGLPANRAILAACSSSLCSNWARTVCKLPAPSVKPENKWAMPSNPCSNRNANRPWAQQGEALNQLRAGAQEMARQIQQQGQSGQDNTGRDGQARGETHDPLGRPDAQQRR